jgi:hypothetical protein
MHLILREQFSNLTFIVPSSIEANPEMYLPLGGNPEDEDYEYPDSQTWITERPSLRPPQAIPPGDGNADSRLPWNPDRHSGTSEFKYNTRAVSMMDLVTVRIFF